MAWLLRMLRLSMHCHKCLIEATWLSTMRQEPQEKGENGLVHIHTNRRLITVLHPSCSEAPFLQGSNPESYGGNPWYPSSSHSLRDRIWSSCCLYQVLGIDKVVAKLSTFEKNATWPYYKKPNHDDIIEVFMSRSGYHNHSKRSKYMQPISKYSKNNMWFFWMAPKAMQQLNWLMWSASGPIFLTQ